MAHDGHIRLRERTEIAGKLAPRLGRYGMVITATKLFCCLAAKEAAKQDGAGRCAMREFLIDEGCGEKVRAFVHSPFI
jgi:hypothetical protein